MDTNKYYNDDNEVEMCCIIVKKYKNTLYVILFSSFHYCKGQHVQTYNIIKFKKDILFGVMAT